MENIFLNILLLLVFLFYFIAVLVEDLLYSIIVLTAGSTALAVIFYILQAPDIALTQAAVGTAVSTVLLVNAVNKTRRKE